jgi:hypothetical protein
MSPLARDALIAVGCGAAFVAVVTVAIIFFMGG